jgi:hypothetical protein
MRETRPCEICGKEFSYKRVRASCRKRLFCSAACAKVKRRRQNERYRKEGRCRAKPRAAIHIRTCVVCGDGFRTSNVRTRSCGPVCGGILAKRLGDIGRKVAALKRNARVCRQCGAGFQRGRGSLGILCSRKCSGDAMRIYATKREAKAAERKRASDRRKQSAPVVSS